MTHQKRNKVPGHGNCGLRCRIYGLSMLYKPKRRNSILMMCWIINNKSLSPATHDKLRVEKMQVHVLMIHRKINNEVNSNITYEHCSGSKQYIRNKNYVQLFLESKNNTTLFHTRNTA